MNSLSSFFLLFDMNSLSFQFFRYISFGKLNKIFFDIHANAMIQVQCYGFNDLFTQEFCQPQTILKYASCYNCSAVGSWNCFMVVTWDEGDRNKKSDLGF